MPKLVIGFMAPQLASELERMEMFVKEFDKKNLDIAKP